MSEDVLQRVGELERIYVAQSELDMRIDDKLRQPEDLTAQVEGVSEARLLTLFRRESLDRLQVHVVVEMEVVQVLRRKSALEIASVDVNNNVPSDG